MMQIGIQIGLKPDSGFDDPIGMLKDCHRRIEHFLRILCVVAERAQGRALNPEETAAVNAAMAYFRTGGARHNADEEESLFPRLRNFLSSAALEEIDGLEHDHRDGDKLHESINALYEQWIKNGSLTGEETAQLASATSELQKIYQAHIALEDNVVFRHASEVLDATAISAIGEEFRKRRA